jgi:hypothetical protein
MQARCQEGQAEPAGEPEPQTISTASRSRSRIRSKAQSATDWASVRPAPGKSSRRAMRRRDLGRPASPFALDVFRSAAKRSCTRLPVSYVKRLLAGCSKGELAHRPRDCAPSRRHALRFGIHTQLRNESRRDHWADDGSEANAARTDRTGGGTSRESGGRRESVRPAALNAREKAHEPPWRVSRSEYTSRRIQSRAGGQLRQHKERRPRERRHSGRRSRPTASQRCPLCEPRPPARALHRRSSMSKGVRSVGLARAAVVALPVIATSLLAAPLQACPSCPTSREARSQVWSHDFALNLLFTALPFLVIGAICVRVEAIGRSGPRI